MASSSSSTIPLLLLLLLSFFAISSSDPLLPPDEQESAYLVLESINSAMDWRSLFPDDLCLSPPHGIVCDYSAEENSTTAHIAELNFGYVSDYSSNPPCGRNPAFTPRISSFPFLRKLLFYKCFNNDPTPLPGYFWNFTSSLEELVFVENPSLVGSIDGRIGNFTNLRRLVISGTGISGNVPASIGELQELEQLVITRSRLSGKLPESWKKLQKLKILDLSYNFLEGNLPPGIGEITNLVKLDLGSNQIGGGIPDRLVGLQKIEFLDLSYNRFFNTGVPVMLAEMPRLREVYLSGNPLGGRIPEIWGKMGGVLGIGLSGVGLVGNIPRSMGVFLEKLCYLGLDNNMLEGEVPLELGQLENVKELNLENNRLSGEIVFYANFTARKMKMKLGGNPGLCVISEKMKGHFGDLRTCRKAARPDAVVLFSGGCLLHASLFHVFGVLILFFQL
ncbi:piriformospora indica-insensitive protein 2-like protein [Cinnamomum micranthum f. kanehirae]|uniref:Piriformospora indica-insensitive protein 2-like protein n=1 Tax=Cinnamomum micranthum f. kanehirae TaxID=337451 RepID=A0A3S3P214_9MAGN|nr:piriformospora indica-insensitive protein 2-like protein [Cinnamomum micranthum f. kanehirae]